MKKCPAVAYKVTKALNPFWVDDDASVELATKAATDAPADEIDEASAEPATKATAS